ncbi:MAG: BamA/TamA family outer membrane protein [candidate division KSB1 bacterium]|nr:BamA/TamA family outer membrane protein [candidate division KSB1 bacterium]MDZ7305136.1 BamA/TamA family outer membrane protein [candidate division KSB1 bacterium]MDZ7314220.1 BamA/TamA family outer membrane protein [candidate division KSB1 bacterium]
MKKLFFAPVGGILSMAVTLLLAQPGYSQTFGKNHVQYKEFKTLYIQSEHFDIYFHEGGEAIAEFVAEVAEQSYKEIKEDFRYELNSRITIIFYNSHNDFEQTNVQIAPPEESVGGFTEFFKNRVVVPYEGNWEKFRHVIHHELTHAVMLQMVYGSGVQSIITGLTRLQLPLWFIEGLSEYESRGWDTESDMFMRDAALNGYIPEIPYLNGFLAYKGGQSILYYISQKYGGEKIGELLGKIKINKSMERGLKSSIGVGVEDLNKRWQKHLKKEYWPDIAGRQEPDEIARQLTDHTKYRNFINNSPALSPKGDKIAFLSDKSDYFDVYLMSAIDGKILSKLVSGQKTGELEELHWLRPGITWSPDSRYIAFAAKSGGEDELKIVEVKKRKIVRSMKFGLDGVFSPTWSPQNDEIAFVGIKAGASDIYTVNLGSEAVRKVTDDVFSDLEPCYSPDGSRLAFVSDRGRYTDMSTLPENFKIWRMDYRNLDIYLVDAVGTANGGRIEQITDTPYFEKTPVFSPDGKKLAFTSDRTGIYNIYIHDLDSHNEYPITNVITGVSHLSWAGDGSRMAFVSFYNAGYDIYLLKNPLDIKPGEINPAKTAFLTQLEQRQKEEHVDMHITAAEAREDRDSDKYRHYVFGEAFAEGVVKTKAEQVAFLDTSQYKNATGAYKIHKYKTKFTPDIIYGNAGYSQYFGVQGQTLFSLSDVLGNHRIDLYTDLFYDIRNSNYQVSYFYLPKRTDFGFGAFHHAWFFYSDPYYGGYGWMRDRYYGLSLYASRPFNTFRRVEGGIAWLNINREFLDVFEDYIHQIYFQFPPRKIRVLIGSVSYVTDTALWGWTGPNNGGRSEFNLTYSPKYDRENGLGFVTFRGDLRKYIKFSKEYNLVFRLAGGLSEGSEPQQFFLGGLDNWLNQSFRGGRIRIDRPEDIYFSSFETPLRGTSYYEQAGNRFALMNLEFRFPMIRYLILGWPLPIGLQNVRGALFTDIGAAWEGKLGKYERFRAFKKNSGFPPDLNDLLMGYGFGSRANLGFLLLRFDVAWTTDLYTSSSKPRYYFSLGTEF